MPRKRRARMIGLILAGALILVGAAYTTAAWAAAGPFSSRPGAQAAQVPGNTDPRSTILEMHEGCEQYMDDADYGRGDCGRQDNGRESRATQGCAAWTDEDESARPRGMMGSGGGMMGSGGGMMGSFNWR